MGGGLASTIGKVGWERGVLPWCKLRGRPGAAQLRQQLDVPCS